MNLRTEVTAQPARDGTIAVEVNALDGPNLVAQLSRQVLDTKEEVTRKALIALGWTPPAEPVDGDAIAKSKRILQLVDLYLEDQTASRRADLRGALMAELERNVTPHQLLEIARATGLRGYLHGVNATDARRMLAEFVAAIPAAANGKQLAHGHRGDYYQLANARRIGLVPIERVKKMPNWVLAMELFATGSTSAHQICRDAGIDPDGYTVER